MSASNPTSNSRNLGQSLAPLVTLGATWGARKVMARGYEKGTGKPAPLVHSREASLVAKVLWAAALAAAVALAQSAVWHFLERDGGVAADPGEHQAGA